MLAVAEQAQQSSSNVLVLGIIGTVLGGIILAQLSWFGKTIIEHAKLLAGLKVQVDVGVANTTQIQDDVRIISGQVSHVEAEQARIAGQLSAAGKRT